VKSLYAITREDPGEMKRYAHGWKGACFLLRRTRASTLLARCLHQFSRLFHCKEVTQWYKNHDKWSMSIYIRHF